MVIRPHENIFSAAKEDRQNLLKALKVNTSPVLMMYQDPERKIKAVLDKEVKRTPVIDCVTPEGEAHKVWAVTDKGAVNTITAVMAKQPFYVADGHHRYTSALTYRREQMAANPKLKADDPVNYVMTTLVDFADPGLIILAPHRVINGLDPQLLMDLQDKLTGYFEITEIPANLPDARQRLDEAMSRPGGIRLGFYGPVGDSFYTLKLRQENVLTQLMPAASDIYRHLDVAVLDNVILNKILGLKMDGRNETRVSFSHDREGAIKDVLMGQQQVVFFLKPLKPELIKTVSDANEKMPRKSTYFYPKAPAGIVVNKLF
jgi:uncharacterized protein (DUF1015 family)